MLYRENSDHATAVESFLRDATKRNLEIEKVELDSREGAEKAKLYSIDQYPALVVTQNDGSVQQIWQGPQLAVISEVEYALSA